jgi:hypothetical protein
MSVITETVELDCRGCDRRIARVTLPLGDNTRTRTCGHCGRRDRFDVTLTLIKHVEGRYTVCKETVTATYLGTLYPATPALLGRTMGSKDIGTKVFVPRSWELNEGGTR